MQWLGSKQGFCKMVQAFVSALPTIIKTAAAVKGVATAATAAKNAYEAFQPKEVQNKTIADNRQIIQSAQQDNAYIPPLQVPPGFNPFGQ